MRMHTYELYAIITLLKTYPTAIALQRYYLKQGQLKCRLVLVSCNGACELNLYYFACQLLNNILCCEQVYMLQMLINACSY